MVDTKNTYFSIFPDNFIGFDKIFDMFSDTKLASSIPSFMPYNLIKVDDAHFKIEVAAAGYNKEDFTVSVDKNILVIDVANSNEQHANQYLYRGISRRGYTRKFALSDTIEVSGAEFKNGLLTIHLKNNIPEEKKSQKIEIK